MKAKKNIRKISIRLPCQIFFGICRKCRPLKGTDDSLFIVQSNLAQHRTISSMKQ